MAIQGAEAKQAAIQVLSGINELVKIGGSDSTISGNSTITALINAINNLPNVLGSSPCHEANQRIGVLLRMGVTIGALSETHGFSTIAAMAASVASQAGIADTTLATDFSE